LGSQTLIISAYYENAPEMIVWKKEIIYAGSIGLGKQIMEHKYSIYVFELPDMGATSVPSFLTHLFKMWGFGG
jgi:hypothetical protein